MLKPCPETVEALLKKIPKKKLATTELLRKELADRHEVQVTCPFDTKQALKAIANGSGKTAYWRVVKANGELISYFPGGLAGHASLLAKEGFTIDTKGKAPKVKGFKENLVRFS
jgi:alkylated DNA nucleotide flippase Atl1